jgi:hypothetical protein
MASSQTGATKFGIQGSKSFTRQGHEQRRGSRTTLNYHHEGLPAKNAEERYQTASGLKPILGGA